MLSGLVAMLQASVLDGLAFHPFSFQLDVLTKREVDVDRCRVADVLVVPGVVVVGDEVSDLPLDITALHESRWCCER